MLAPALLTLIALSAAPATSITNTGTVHDLAAFADRVIACTEGGLDVFSARGQHLRTLHREDGLPSHFCRALRVVGGGHLLAATDEGLAVLDRKLRVIQVLPFRWAALPPTDGALRQAQGERRLEPGLHYTAFARGYAGTADGRVIRLSDHRVWSVPGPVLVLEETGAGLRIGTAEGHFQLGPTGLTVLPRVGVGPFAYSGGGSGLQVLTADGARFRWSGERLEDDAPRHTAAWLQAFGRSWAGTANGVYTLEAQGWVRRTPAHQLCGNHITAVARFQGRLVVGTFDHGVCWQDDSGRWTSFRAPALPSDHVLAIAADGPRLYVATEYGVGLWNGRTWRQLARGGRNPLRFERLSVLAAADSGEGKVAFADGGGVSFSLRGRFDHRLPLPGSWARHPTVAAVSGRFAWYGSEDRGLARFDGSTWSHFHDGRELTDNWITALDVDEKGRAVAGTCQDGFNYFDGEGWTQVRASPHLRTGDVTAVALAPNGAVVGTLLGAVRFDAAEGRITELPPLADPRVSAIRIEPEGIWFGTQGGLSFLSLDPPALPKATARR